MPVHEPPERIRDQVEEEAPDSPNAQIFPPGGNYIPDNIATSNIGHPVPRPVSAPPIFGCAAFVPPASAQNNARNNSPSASPASDSVAIADPATGPRSRSISQSAHEPVGTSLSIPPSAEQAPSPAPVSIDEVPSAASSGSNTIDDDWKGLKGFIRVLDNCSGAFGPLKMMIDNLAQCINVHEEALAPRQDYTTLKTELEALFSELGNHLSGDSPPAITASMDNIRCAIGREVEDTLNRKDKQGDLGHYEAEKLDELMEHYRRVHDHLKRLSLNTNPDLWKLKDEQATEARLDKLLPSMSACYDSAEADLVRRRECTPQTRTQVLVDLGIWRHDKNQGNLYWLNGMAGTGKTTIASSLCAMLDRSHELGASFFCTRLLPECRNTKLIIPTIAYQLARFSRPFCAALFRMLERHPDIRTKSLSKQLEGMIIAPLLEVVQALPRHLMVVVDALDECEDSEGVEQLLEVLVRHDSELPIKVFLSSRPELQICNVIADTKHQTILHELQESIVKGDIEIYLRAELASILSPELQIGPLVERAGVWFIYAATVVRYILSERFHLARRKRLESVLATIISGPSNKYKDIDALYGAILASAFNNHDLEDADRERMKLALDTIVCAQEPLTVDALAGLLQLGDVDWAHIALRPLWSVLHVSGTNGLVAPLHTSFLAFMLDPKRSEPHTCKDESHHGRLAELCFERIEKNACQFNVCGLESSYLLDKQVPDLEDRVKRAIPRDLEYACRYWAVHLELSGQSSKRDQLLREFLSKQLLLWTEVLNLKKRMHIGATLLEKARRWYNRGSGTQKTMDLIHDAWRFVTMFAADTVSSSTPHIYVSVLASWPSSSPLAACYIPRTRGLAKVGGTGLKRRQSALLSAFTVGNNITSVALSPDGMQVVSGAFGAAIYVWDVQSGQQVLGPLRGHTGFVYSVAFSPDGMLLASGSSDNTVRMWDVQSGQLVLGPLKGHTDSVKSLAFSPDGKHIGSGSSDHTIYLWDVQSGQQALGPLEGHTNSVSSVAFSPDGMHLASGSWDRTIRVWGAKSGKLVLGPLNGHSSLVYSVAFSPDGMRIVSGSADDSICVWDVRSGQQVLGPLTGHTDSVSSVAFSPDGMRIISGSSDNTVRVWNVQSGQKILGPLKGHNGQVISVAFAPDSMRIVSGSNDGTICVWDVHSEQQGLEKLKGHTGMVNSVVFSLDSRRIISGSEDNTICVWDAQNGQQVLSPGKEHTGGVKSVSYSPDSLQIVSGSSDRTIRVWDVQSRKQALRPLKHTDRVRSVAFSPDGMRIASGSEDNTICVWDAHRGKQVLEPLKGHTNWVLSVAFSPDGTRIVSGSRDTTICVWSAQGGQQILGPLKEHARSVNSVAFSPDSMHIVSGSDDGTICVRDSRGQRLLGPLRRHTDSVNSVAFSPEGVRIVSGSDDKTICICDAQSGELVVGPLMGHTAPVKSVAFSSNGTRIVSGSGDNTIRVWAAQNSYLSPSGVSSPSSELLPSWVLDKNGWAIDQKGHWLLWVPPDLRNRLLANRTVLLISTEGSVDLDFRDAKIGQSWADCYVPA